MPGWYIHMEAARQAVDRLRAGDVPEHFPGGAARAKQLGDIAHKWRNYLAWGAIGPDIFYLLPDFKPPVAELILIFIQWYFQDNNFDEQFKKPWDLYAKPTVRGVGDILNQVSGGLIREIGGSLQELVNAFIDGLLDIVAHLWDWFGLFGSGVSSGLSEREFYWSDMFHYRKTYTFARKLFANAITDQQKAFALGWMTHCATDVTGHPFVNQKVGGPWRLHWQRHHLVENHMDAKVYDTQHHGIEPYGELDTSCLHFRLAFRHRDDDVYSEPDGTGFDDAPAYDYFKGFPPYDTSDSDSGDIKRDTFFDLDTGDLAEGKNGSLNDDLCNFLLKTIKEVYPDPVPPSQTLQAPQILRCTDPAFHEDDSGRPSAAALKNTFAILYEYVKTTSTSGYSPAPPQPPPVFNDHSPPSFPIPNEDPARGADIEDNFLSDVLAVFFAVFAFALWLAEFAVWLITLPDAVVADLLTYVPRELLYQIAVQPLYSLYLAMRHPLVMSAFLQPKHSEILTGLVQLGVSPAVTSADLAAALQSPDAVWPQSPPTNEPSGRAAMTGDAFEVDTQYPRAIIEDTMTDIQKRVGYILGKIDPHVFCFQTTQPSEFLRPWRYPDINNAGISDGSEPAPTHPGPWAQGHSAEVLMNTSPGDPQARQAFERAKTPEECETISDGFFKFGAHLGDPVDYSVYLIGRLTDKNLDAKIPPDFNLDSDRGYGYHCWDWDRNATIHQQKPPTFCPNPTVSFAFNEPCTVPEGFCNPDSDSDVGPHYCPTTPLFIHFEEQPNPQCVTPQCVMPEEKLKPKL